MQELLARNWEVKVQHIYREANQVADLLASLGDSLFIGLYVYFEPPSTLLPILSEDLRGVTLPHLICLIRYLGFCPIYLPKKK